MKLPWHKRKGIKLDEKEIQRAAGLITRVIIEHGVNEHVFYAAMLGLLNSARAMGRTIPFVGIHGGK